MLYPPIGIRLMGWTRQVIRALYGTVNPDDGKRQYRHAYVSVSKQNGKTFLVGGLPIYHLIAEDVEYPEAYGCAAAKDQGGLVFKAAAMLVRANPDLQSRLRVLESSKRILLRDGRGMYIVISADGKVQDGIRPSLLIRDEVHRWRGAGAKTLYDVTTKGQISRDEPLDIGMSTAGAEYESPLWFQEYSQAKRILSGAVRAPSYYAAIWEPDLKRIENDPEYWKSREARVAANPSHEDLGGFLKDAAIVSEMEKAISQPAEKSAYLRYNLNVPIKQEEDPIVDMSAWMKCDGGVDLRECPEFDRELLIRQWNLLEKPCFVGVDASWTTDFTSVVLIFPPFAADNLGPGSDGRWTLMPFFWVPKDNVTALEQATWMPIGTWIAQKFVEATPGPVIDMRYAMDLIKWARQMFTLVEMPYDRMNFRSEALKLSEEEGIIAPEVPQNFLGLSAATKFLIALAIEGKLRHGNHPVLNWMASCLQLQYDKKDNCQPTKPERKKSAKRIDGMQATITGLSRAIVVNTNIPTAIEVW